ncbi:M15 family metallopeptidase [Paenibacillus donghaensis]|uniref:D-Ala-D-Ala carboxypeptidase VanY n=1 Tax=Paenibacillus donghaensis TaxID=414771 RepID=A0A2Z2KUL5_9BACL|nr:M15 family metallopeptidase [Paenibacillus donghaensis]ASA24781.1 D-Ala-D-Ala carboxypeptidase VanY [Paenibacillus donghaensis]
MKKWGLVILVILLGYAVYEYRHELQQDIRIVMGEQSDQGGFAEHSKTIKIVLEDQVHQGDLLLVNKEYPVHPGSVKADIIDLMEHQDIVQGYGLLDNGIRLSKQVAEKFQQMVEAAAQDGVTHFMISSGYRSFEEQELLYKEKGAAYALPAGYSEHNLGLSMDIGSTLKAMNEAPEGKWLQKNAWKYGFILRYPKDKMQYTGIEYEPWHFRYVGLPHSGIMYEQELVLEQYIDLLQEQRSLSATIGGERYNVSYVAVSGNAPLKVPETGEVVLSGDNRGGIIVTVKE